MIQIHAYRGLRDCRLGCPWLRLFISSCLLVVCW